MYQGFCETVLSANISRVDHNITVGARFPRPYNVARVQLTTAVSRTDKRDRDGAWRELERSLKRLNIAGNICDLLSQDRE